MVCIVDLAYMPIWVLHHRIRAALTCSDVYVMHLGDTTPSAFLQRASMGSTEVMVGTLQSQALRFRCLRPL